MQKALTSRHPTENDCFAGDAVEDAEEADIPLSSVSVGGQPLCNLRFADDIDLLGSSQKELQELRSDKSKILVNNIKPRPSTNIMNE